MLQREIEKFFFKIFSLPYADNYSMSKMQVIPIIHHKRKFVIFLLCLHLRWRFQQRAALIGQLLSQHLFYEKQTALTHLSLPSFLHSPSFLQLSAPVLEEA